ncbi:hypothetical protein GC105_12140 [Alkalibaculum sp. M08DMB]|uniref:Sigma-54 factor interaction domain-containing protein n=1 Tax=Alkalibaculum sporogenes TaxID=2655001 RepID=A0A6A7KAG3_9FIRM|nr:sigma 54-interacting transcriptional regulator [Alkalibaculum sporogenes]MPW26539.1 hypothetical protein [Alkalibaculum sporogenes]
MKLNYLFDSMKVGLIVADNNMEIVAINAECEKMLSLDRSVILGRKIHDIAQLPEKLISLINSNEEVEYYLINSNLNNTQCQYFVSKKIVISDNYHIVTFHNFMQINDIANSIKDIESDAFSEIIGNSIYINSIKEICRLTAQNDNPILLTGECGTKKHRFARAIHVLSNRNNNPFLSLDLRKLPENAVLRELFGYDKEKKILHVNINSAGLFEKASGGTLFLRGLENLSSKAIKRILHVIKYQELTQGGSKTVKHINVRVIASLSLPFEHETNESMQKTFENNIIRIPSLRECPEDLPIYINYIINQINPVIQKNILGITKSYINELSKLKLETNFIELTKVVEKSMLITTNYYMTSEDLSFLSENKVKNLNCIKRFSNLSLSQIMDDKEKNIIEKALIKYKSIRQTAIALGVSHTSIINKMKMYNIKLNN